MDERFTRVVNKWISEMEYPIDDWGEDTKIEDFGGDSLDATELTMMLENEFRFAIDGIFEPDMTLGDVWSQIKEMRGW